MRTPRRTFLRTALAATASASAARRGRADDVRRPTPGRLREVAEAPVLRVEGLDRPVIIAAMDLLRHRREFLVRVRTQDGAEGLVVANSMHLVHTIPIFLNRVAPSFKGKDARELVSLLWELYRRDDN